MMEIYGLNGGLSKHSAAENKIATVLLDNAMITPYASATSDDDDERVAPSNITLILLSTGWAVKT